MGTLTLSSFSGPQAVGLLDQICPWRSGWSAHATRGRLCEAKLPTSRAPKPAPAPPAPAVAAPTVAAPRAAPDVVAAGVASSAGNWRQTRSRERSSCLWKSFLCGGGKEKKKVSQSHLESCLESYLNITRNVPTTAATMAKALPPPSSIQKRWLRSSDGSGNAHWLCSWLLASKSSSLTLSLAGLLRQVLDDLSLVAPVALTTAEFERVLLAVGRQRKPRKSLAETIWWRGSTLTATQVWVGHALGGVTADVWLLPAALRKIKSGCILYRTTISVHRAVQASAAIMYVPNGFVTIHVNPLLWVNKHELPRDQNMDHVSDCSSFTPAQGMLFAFRVEESYLIPSLPPPLH